jgi:hypothetical protein
VVRGVQLAMARSGGGESPKDYLITNTSERVVNFMISTAFQHATWAGLRGE